MSAPVQPEIKPLLLLPPALAVSAALSLPIAAKPLLEELLTGVNIDNLHCAQLGRLPRR